MESLRLILDGDGAFPDLPDREVITTNRGTMARLKAGMTSGKSSVVIRIDIDDKQTVMFQTSLALLEAGVRAFKARDEYDQGKQ